MRSREAALPLQLAHRAMRPRPLVMLPCLCVLPMTMVVLLVRVSMLRLWLLVTLVTLTLVPSIRCFSQPLHPWLASCDCM